MTIWHLLGFGLVAFVGAAVGAYAGVFLFFLWDLRQCEETRASLDRTERHMDALDALLKESP